MTRVSLDVGIVDRTAGRESSVSYLCTAPLLTCLFNYTCVYTILNEEIFKKELFISVEIQGSTTPLPLPPPFFCSSSSPWKEGGDDLEFDIYRGQP